MSKITLTSVDANNAYASLRPQVEGIGTTITESERTIAQARKSVESLLPLALSFAMLSRLTGASAKEDSQYVGIRPDMFAIYAIAGALVVHGVTPDQARADVVAAVNVSKASKPVLWEAACVSLAAFRKAVKEAASARAEQDEQAEAEASTEASTGASTEASTEAEEASPEKVTHDLVVGFIAAGRGLAKVEPGTLTEDDARAIVRMYSALSKAHDLAAVLETMLAEQKSKRAQAKVEPIAV